MVKTRLRLSRVSACNQWTSISCSVTQNCWLKLWYPLTRQARLRILSWSMMTKSQCKLRILCKIWYCPIHCLRLNLSMIWRHKMMKSKIRFRISRSSHKIKTQSKRWCWMVIIKMPCPLKFPCRSLSRILSRLKICWWPLRTSWMLISRIHKLQIMEMRSCLSTMSSK